MKATYLLLTALYYLTFLKLKYLSNNRKNLLHPGSFCYF